MDFWKRFNQSQKVGQEKIFDGFFVWICKSENTKVKNYSKQIFFSGRIRKNESIIVKN